MPDRVRQVALTIHLRTNRVATLAVIPILIMPDKALEDLPCKAT